MKSEGMRVGRKVKFIGWEKSGNHVSSKGRDPINLYVPYLGSMYTGCDDREERKCGQTLNGQMTGKTGPGQGRK